MRLFLSSFVSRAMYPSAQKLGLIDMGFGIERRYQALAKDWHAHLQHCKEVQSQWIDSLGGSAQEQKESGSLLVLGAGRLLDLDLSLLRESFTEVDLFDADPNCKRFWRRSGVGTQHMHICEFTRVLLSWRRELREKIATLEWEEALSFLRGFGGRSTPSSGFLERVRTPKAILSLNVLSQIPLLWQNIVEQELKDRFNAVTNAKEDEWLAAIQPSAQSLVKQHLRDLAVSGADEILLISDIEYAHYFDGPRYQSRWGALLPFLSPKTTAVPVAFTSRDSSIEWHATDSNVDRVEVMSALFNTDISATSLSSETFRAHEVRILGEWTWHIQPRGFEDNTRGTVHAVRAYRFHAS